MDTDNDLEEINVLDIQKGMRIRATKAGDVVVEGPVFSNRGGAICLGLSSAFTIYAPGWKFYKVYTGAEVNRG